MLVLCDSRKQRHECYVIGFFTFTFTSHYFTLHAAWIGRKIYDVTEIKYKGMHMYSCVIAENMDTSDSGIEFKEFIKQAAFVQFNRRC
jgi:hypothetical protein